MDDKVYLKDMQPIPADDSLFYHLYEKILSGELRTFEDLAEHVSTVPETADLRKCLFNAFKLQRKLYWGFFKGLTQKKYPKLWKEVVLSHPKYKFGGTLKRSMSIPDIYMGLLDIHGYTKFCYDKKENLSMIDLLDRMIHEDVKCICSKNSVMSQRARGDEVLLVGASAADVLKTILQLMEYFNTQGRSFPDTVLRKRLPGTILPKFKISAGIAGGQKYTPLIITRDGDLSGDLVNTAARLQTKANKISPDDNRILITSHVYQKIKTDTKQKGEPVVKDVDFYKVGLVEFKGTNLMVYDIIFLPTESFRLGMKKPAEELMDSLKKQQWNSRVFNCALNLAGGIIKDQLECCWKKSFTNDSLRLEYKALLQQLKAAAEFFNDCAYEKAIDNYSRIVETLETFERKDPIASEYLNLVREGYNDIFSTYSGAMDEEVEVYKNELFGPRELESYQALKKFKLLQKKFQSQARVRLGSRKKVWNRVTNDIGSELRGSLQSLK